MQNSKYAQRRGWILSSTSSLMREHINNNKHEKQKHRIINWDKILT